ncbi:MAG: hypothetical protein U9Q87_09795 [Pseudomonadota bacterium]|nr:hypothetical protein [Pseudomonadota bacterium]
MILDTWVIFCVYSRERISKNKAALFSLLQSLKYAGVAKVLFVDNAQGKDELMVSELTSTQDTYLIKGSNKNAEFSAWLEGMHFIKNKQPEAKINYILMNDTIYSNYQLYELKKLKFIKEIIDNQKRGSELSIVGDKTRLAFNSKCLNYEYNSFVCTALFYITHRASGYFESSCNAAIESWPKRLFTNFESFEILRSYFNEPAAYGVGRWLFTTGWHSANPYQSFDKNLLRLKITAIACEHYFSATIINNGGTMVDSNIRQKLSLIEMLNLYFSLPLPLKVQTLMRKLKLSR